MHKCKVFLSLALTLFLLCSSLLPAGLTAIPGTAVSVESAATSDWLAADADARQNIMITNPSDAVLTDMPVLVRLDSTNIPNPDGVSFYAGTEVLASELASREEGGVSTYWVKVPELAASGDTVLAAYYGGSAAPAFPTSEVWSEQYDLVQHFSENAVGAAWDSTGTAALTKTGTLTYKQDALGGAAVFDGSQKIAYTNRAVGAGAEVYSASAVVNFTSLAGEKGYYGIVCRDRNASKEGDTFMLTLSNANVNASVYANGETGSRVNVQKGITAGTTYLLTMTYDGTDLKLYINGELAGTNPAENAVLLDSPLSPFTIGAYSDETLTSGLRGDLYDVFFKTSVITPAEEQFRYANYLGGGVTLGALETRETGEKPLSPGNHYLYDAILEDTYCFSNNEEGRTANFGTDKLVMQKRTNVSDAPDFQSSANRRAFVKLDLTRLARLDPDQIESAAFEFYQTGNGGATDSAAARIVDVEPDSWQETEVTWKTMPATYGLPVVATQKLTKKQDAYQSFDITNYIKDKLAEGKTAISFSLDNEPSSEWGLIWSSREAEANKPRLTVKIREPEPPALSAEVTGTSATLTAKIQQNPEDVTGVQFYEAKNILLTEENTVVYSGETDAVLPDLLNTADAENTEAFGGESKTTVGNGKTPYQIYEITLSGEEQAQKEINVTWTGNTGDQQREVTGYYYDHGTGQWVKAASGSGRGTFSLDLKVPLENALDERGKLQLLIWRGMNEAIEGRSSYAPPVGAYDFNFMWTTDTQFYPTTTSGKNHVKKQFEWIADHFDAMKSKLLVHTGDMVDNYDSAEQWQAMSDLYQNTIEKAKIPNAFIVGNHDVNRGKPELNIFQNYFPVSRLQENNPYFGEKYDDMTYYYLMEERGAKFLIMGVGIPVTQDAVDWVNSVLARYPDYNVILLTHIYLLADGSIDNTGKYGAEMTMPQVRSIVENNSNVKLILCGHWDGASTNLEYFDGRPVWAMMHDYQGHTEGGSGYFRFLKFDIENNLIYTHTYSASTGGTAVYTDKQPAKTGLYQKNRDEYAIQFDFGATQERVLVTESMGCKASGLTGEPIGTLQEVTGSGSASVVWDGLEEGNTYSWYVMLADKEGVETTTEIQTFTIPKLTIEDISYEDGVVTVRYTAVGVAEGTPIAVNAFAVGENDGSDTEWNGQNVTYQDIFPYSEGKNELSFQMPLTTGNGVAGLDTTKVLLVKLGGEAMGTDSRLFVMPEEVTPEIEHATVEENGRVTVRLNRSVRKGEVLAAAAYDEEGRMIGIKYGAVAAAGSREYTMDIPEAGGAETVKVLWWTGMDAMKPLCGTKAAERE